MPYNPSSAYPRHSTYTPPVFNRGFARGFNEIDWGQKFGHPNVMPSVDIGHALRAAMQRPTSEHVALALQGQNRKGIFSMLGSQAKNEAERRVETTRTRKMWNRAEYGDDPNETAGQSAEPQLTPLQAARGGREHVGGVNDRLQDFAARETRSTGVEKAVESIFTSKAGGTKTVEPLLIMGSSTSRRRGGK